MIKNFILQKFVALLWFGFCLFFFLAVSNYEIPQYLFSSKSEVIQNIHKTFKPLFYRNIHA